MYALFEVNGKQYKAQEGVLVCVDRLHAEKGAELEFPTLFVKQGDKIRLGTPYVDSSKVSCVVEDHKLGPKIIIGKHNRTYRKTQGHRSHQTLIRITSIV